MGVSPKGLEIILKNKEPFLKTLKQKGYTKHSFERHKKTLDWFIEYLNSKKIYQKDILRYQSTLDDFVKWKLGQRQKKKYHPEYRDTLRLDINRFLDWHFSYNRGVLENRLKQYLAKQKFRYTRKYLEVKSELLSFFDYLERHRFDNLRQINDPAIKDHVDEKEKRFYKEKKSYSHSHEKITLKACLKNFYRYLWQQGIKWLSFPLKLPKEEREVRFFEWIFDYHDWAKDVRGLSRHSLWKIKHELKKLDWYLQDQGVKSLKKLKLKHIDGYIAATYDRENVVAIQGACHPIRGFLRHLKRQKEIKKDLSELIVCPPRYRLSHVPKYLKSKELEKILNGVDRTTPQGIRKHAVLSLLFFNGLRAGEVAKLTLDDIDWEEREIVVRNRKNADDLLTPLRQEVASALKEYILKVRPNERPERQIFFTLHAPIRPVASGAVIQHISKYFKKFDLPGGAHRLRHTHAQHMLESGKSFKDVKEALGHKKVTSAQIYAMTNIEKMRKYVVHTEF